MPIIGLHRCTNSSSDKQVAKRLVTKDDRRRFLPCDAMHIAKRIVEIIISPPDTAIVLVFLNTLFDDHCFHMGTAIKHPVPDRVKSSFVIFDIRHSDAQD